MSTPAHSFSSEQAVQLLGRWIDIPSVSGQEADYLHTLESFFTEQGWCVRRQEVEANRWNLLVTTSENASPSLVYSTHVDTVPPHLPFRDDSEKLFGRGACDTKGGLLAQIMAASRLRHEHPRGESVGFLLVVGEEVDHCGAIAARSLDWSPSNIVLCEPTRNRLVTAQKGVLKVVLRTHGVAGHSAFPDKGRSAVEPLLDALEKIRREEWPGDPVLGPTTLNIGILEAGVAANVFAPEAEAHLMFRLVSPSSGVLQRVKELAGDADVIEQTTDEPQRLFIPDGDWDTAIAAFNSDAAHLSQLGPVTMGGPGDIQVAHSDHEHISRASFFAGVDLYTRLGRTLLDDT